MKLRIALALVLALITTVARADSTPPLGWPVTPPAQAKTPIGALTPQSPVLHFSGKADNPTPLPLVNPAPAPPVCAVEVCDRNATTRAGRPTPMSCLAAVSASSASASRAFSAWASLVMSHG